MDKELLRAEIYTKATNIQVIVMNNLNNITIDYLIAEINSIKKSAEELKREMEM